MKFRIHRLAVAEIDHEVDYYESRRVGLGAELEDEIDAVLETILQFPEAAPQWRNRPDRRFAVLDRFPFAVPLSDQARRDRDPRARTHKPASGILVTPPLRQPSVSGHN